MTNGEKRKTIKKSKTHPGRSKMLRPILLLSTNLMPHLIVFTKQINCKLVTKTFESPVKTAVSTDILKKDLSRLSIGLML